MTVSFDQWLTSSNMAGAGTMEEYQRPGAGSDPLNLREQFNGWQPEDTSVAQGLQDKYKQATDPANGFGSEGLDYAHVANGGSGHGFFNDIPRVSIDGKDYARVGNNVNAMLADKEMRKFIDENGGPAAMFKNDPQHGVLMDTSNPAFQQMSEAQRTRNGGLWNTPLPYIAMLGTMAAGGAYMGAAGAGEGTAAGVGEGVASGTAGYGSSGLTEGTLASESNFTPGSFELGSSGYSGSATAGLDAAAAEGAAQAGTQVADKGILSKVMDYAKTANTAKQLLSSNSSQGTQATQPTTSAPGMMADISGLNIGVRPSGKKLLTQVRNG